MRSTGFLVHPLNPGRVCIITILLFYYKTQTFTPLSSFNKQQMCEHMCKLQLRQSKHDNTLYKHTNLRFYLGALACNYRCFLLLSHTWGSSWSMQFLHHRTELQKQFLFSKYAHISRWLNKLMAPPQLTPLVESVLLCATRRVARNNRGIF